MRSWPPVKSRVKLSLVLLRWQFYLYCTWHYNRNKWQFTFVSKDTSCSFSLYSAGVYKSLYVNYEKSKGKSVGLVIQSHLSTSQLLLSTCLTFSMCSSPFVFCKTLILRPHVQLWFHRVSSVNCERWWGNNHIINSWWWYAGRKAALKPSPVVDKWTRNWSKVEFWRAGIPIQKSSQCAHWSMWSAKGGQSYSDSSSNTRMVAAKCGLYAYRWEMSFRPV